MARRRGRAVSAFMKIEARDPGTLVADKAGLRKPLYIVARDRVQIRANEAFLVVQPDAHPVRYFAFARLDRIICHAGVDWSGEALTRCLQHRVTISWLTGRGELLGYCIPRVTSHEPFHHCMERFAGLPSASVRWENWFRHRRMFVLSAWAESKAKCGAPVAEQTFRELTRGFVYRQEPILQLSAELLGPFQSYIVARLARERVECSYRGRNDTTINLLEHLTLLLWGHANLDAGSLASKIQERKIQWQFLEAWQKDHFATLDEHFVNLKLFLVGILKASP